MRREPAKETAAIIAGVIAMLIAVWLYGLAIWSFISEAVRLGT